MSSASSDEGAESTPGGIMGDGPDPRTPPPAAASNPGLVEADEARSATEARPELATAVTVRARNDENGVRLTYDQWLAVKEAESARLAELKAQRKAAKHRAADEAEAEKEERRKATLAKAEASRQLFWKKQELKKRVAESRSRAGKPPQKPDPVEVQEAVKAWVVKKDELRKKKDAHRRAVRRKKAEKRRSQREESKKRHEEWLRAKVAERQQERRGSGKRGTIVRHERGWNNKWATADDGEASRLLIGRKAARGRTRGGGLALDVSARPTGGHAGNSEASYYSYYSDEDGNASADSEVTQEYYQYYEYKFYFEYDVDDGGDDGDGGRGDAPVRRSSGGPLGVTYTKQRLRQSAVVMPASPPLLFRRVNARERARAAARKDRQERARKARRTQRRPNPWE